jgi:hypothetical protein
LSAKKIDVNLHELLHKLLFWFVNWAVCTDSAAAKWGRTKQKRTKHQKHESWCPILPKNPAFVCIGLHQRKMQNIDNEHIATFCISLHDI